MNKIFILTSFLLICFGNLDARSQSDQVARKCDFSKYKAWTISHFLFDSTVTIVKPKYPLTAKSVNASGRVSVAIIVDRKGDVVDACVIDGHPLLRFAVQDAVMKWKFQKDFGFGPKLKRDKKFVQVILQFDFN